MGDAEEFGDWVAGDAAVGVVGREDGAAEEGLVSPCFGEGEAFAWATWRSWFLGLWF